MIARFCWWHCGRALCTGKPVVHDEVQRVRRTVQIPAPLQPLHQHQYCVSSQAACSSHSGQAVRGTPWTRELSSQVPAQLTNKDQHDATLEQFKSGATCEGCYQCSYTGSDQVDCKLDMPNNLACDKSNWMGKDKVIKDAICSPTTDVYTRRDACT